MTKNILMVLDAEFPPDSRVEKEVKSLIRDGYNITLLCRTKVPNIKKEETLWGKCRVVRLKILPKVSEKHAINRLTDFILFPILATVKTVQLLMKKKYSAVIVANPPDLLLIPINIVAKLSGLKVINDFHDPFPELIKTHYPNKVFEVVAKLAERIALATCDSVITVNSACRRLLKRSTRKKIHLLHNYPNKEFKPDKKQVSLIKKQYPAKTRVLHLGNLRKQMGCYELAKAASDIAPFLRKSKSVVIIAGDGAERKPIERLVKKHNVQDVVKVPGRIPYKYVASYIEASDIIVIPERKFPLIDITLPVKLLEAIKLKKLVIISDFNIIRDYVGNSVEYVPADNQRALKRKLTQTIVNRARLEKKKKPQLEKLSKKFRWEREDNVLKKLIEGSLK